MSAAHAFLRGLEPGAVVPAECYVLDYADGIRPRWTVHSAETRGAGVLRLVLIDPDNAGGLVEDGRPVAVTVITWPAKTLRSQPYPLGTTPRPMLCDMDQQARANAEGEPGPRQGCEPGDWNRPGPATAEVA